MSDNFLRPGTILRSSQQTYTIVRVLGSGGFGITYLASTTVRFGNISATINCAIKEHFMDSESERNGDSVVCPGTAKSKALVANSLRDFIGEARRLEQVGKKHPNIVKVNEIFEANGTAYYVMEYLEGRSLAQYIADNGPLKEDAVRALVLPIVEAAACLHSQHMTHLDIKPQNIMIVQEGDGSLRPVLIDFGLSKHYNPDGSATSTVNTMACSDGYAPTEQYQGITSFRPTADVYALGATMLHCATGRIPTKSGDWQPGEPAATITSLPLGEQLREVIARAMSPSAYDRYADAGAMLAALGGQPAAESVDTRTIAQQLKDKKTEVIGGEKTAPTGKSHRWLVGTICALGALIILTLVGVFININNTIEQFQQEDFERILANSRQPQNLHLAVRQNGNYYYLSQSDWRTMNSSQKSGLKKLGVVIIGNGERFILALEDLPGGRMTWYDAMSRYSDRMPTKAQGEAWMAQDNAVKNAVLAFGGHWPNSWGGNYWTKTEYDSSLVWLVTMDYGYVGNYYKTNTGRVRPVAPVAAAI